MKKTLAIILAALMLCSLLCGCGASAPMDTGAKAESMKPVYDYADGFAADMVVGSSASNSTNGNLKAPQAAPMAPAMPMEPESAKGQESTQTAPMEEKIIYSAYVDMETLDFDKTVTDLEAAVLAAGGFIQNSEKSGNSSYDTDGTVHIMNRRAYYVVRIPADKFNSFLENAGGLGNIVSNNKTAENVTSQYQDFEARMTSLKTEESRLLELMQKAEDINALIQLESRLSQVRYDIESIQRNLSNLDKRIAYSTVNFNIREVRVYQPSAKVQRTFGQRIADSFTRGWENFVDDLGDFFVDFVGAIFPLTVFAAVVIVVVIIVRRKMKKVKAGKFIPKEEKTEE